MTTSIGSCCGMLGWCTCLFGLCVCVLHGAWRLFGLHDAHAVLLVVVCYLLRSCAHNMWCARARAVVYGIVSCGGVMDILLLALVVESLVLTAVAADERWWWWCG